MTKADKQKVAHTLARFKIAGGAVLELWQAGSGGSKCVLLTHRRRGRVGDSTSFTVCLVKATKWTTVFRCFDPEHGRPGELAYACGNHASGNWGRLQGVPKAFLRTLARHDAQEREDIEANA